MPIKSNSIQRAFFNPVTKFKPQNIDAIVQNHLLDNVKSVLIVPFFGAGNALLGLRRVTQ